MLLKHINYSKEMGSCVCKEKLEDSKGTTMLLNLHGPAKQYDELFNQVTLKIYKRHLIEMMLKYGKVSFTYDNLYLVSKYRYITPISILLLMNLHQKGACIPFYEDNGHLYVYHGFPTGEERKKIKFNFLIAANEEMWKQINTCIKASDIRYDLEIPKLIPPPQDHEDNLAVDHLPNTNT